MSDAALSWTITGPAAGPPDRKPPKPPWWRGVLAVAVAAACAIPVFTSLSKCQVSSHGPHASDPWWQQTGYPAYVTDLTDSLAVSLQSEAWGEHRVQVDGLTCPTSRHRARRQAYEAFRTQILNRWLFVTPATRPGTIRRGDLVLLNGDQLSVLAVAQGVCQWNHGRGPNDNELKTAEHTARRNRVGMWAHDQS